MNDRQFSWRKYDGCLSEAAEFLIVGCGQVGYRAASLLLALGEPVHVLTQGGRRDWRRRLEAAGARFTEGDATDHVVLKGSGLEECRAILICTSDDVTNIRIALEVKRLCPGVKIVARLFDQLLAERLEKGIGVARALAMSVVAAPSFACAAAGSHVLGEFRVDKRRFVMCRSLVASGSQLRGLTPPETRTRFGVETVARTGEDENAPIAEGETLTLLGDPASLRFLPEVARLEDFRKRKSGQMGRIWRAVPSNLKILTAALTILTLVSCAVFNLGMGLRPIDAFYFVVTTLSTTGYGDITANAASDAMKIYTCALMILGTAAVAILYSIMTDMIVTARFKALTGEKPVPSDGHVIVVGIGNVGFRVVEELQRSGVEVVAVDIDPDGKYAASLKTRVPFIVGDAREPEILRAANLEHARSLVVTTQDDAVNLSVGLLSKLTTARVRTVLRIFDASFAAAVEEVMELDVALSASRLAAPEFVAAALYDEVVAAYVLQGRLIALSAEGPAGREVHIDGQKLGLHMRELTNVRMFDEA